MPKEITKQERVEVIKWLKGEVTFAEMSRRLKMNPRTSQGYTRIALTLKKLYSENKIICK